MPSPIFLEINQTLLRGGQRLSRRFLDAALNRLQTACRIPKDFSVSLAFVSLPTMRTLNKRYRGKDHPTDVLSFALEDRRRGGEILLCYPVALRQARKKGHPIRHELVFLFVHGFLHLLGYAHEAPADKQKMSRLQEKVLMSLGINPEWEID